VTARAKVSVYTIPAGVAFARSLAEGVIARVGSDPLALSGVTIFVPTRRAIRTLREEFALAQSGVSLGPNIHALGDLDEEGISFGPSADEFTLAPAIAPLKRRLELARLVAAWHEKRGESLPFAQALSQAGELGRFLDEATEQKAELEKLEDIAPESLAEHWQDVRDFLQIIAEHWPNFLTANGLLEPAARRDVLIRRQAESYAAISPANWVIAAGSTGSVPATRDLLRVIAHLPKGAVVLPGLDHELDDESWKELDEGHPQYGLRELLVYIGVGRDDVDAWNPIRLEMGEPRRRFLSAALRPPPTTDAWRELIENNKEYLSVSLEGVALIEAANQHEEALAIAIALREVLETPDETAALVTPDRGLARRVASELARWQIAIDDSAGTPLARTPPGAFLTLLVSAAADGFSPVALLALLKHPLSAGGMNRAAFRARVRELEVAALRGIAPDPVLPGVDAILVREGAPQDLRDWFSRLAVVFENLQKAFKSDGISLAEIVTAHVEAAEWLAGTDEKSGAEFLWHGDAGAAAGNLVAELIEHGNEHVLTKPDQYADAFRDVAEARVVRARFGRHPRLSILGPLEARLQHFGLVILGSLNEGTWPNETTSDPWLSRPMRKAIGLEAPERQIGLAAHDFYSLAASPRVILTRSKKAEGAPTTPSRWMLRAKQLAKGLGIETALDARAELLAWTRGIDDGKREKRAQPPEPRPPADARPRRLSVTEIERWLRDPYAVYAKHVLRLKPLDPIDLEPGPRERGIAIHKALERFLLAHPDALPADAYEILLAFGEEEFANAGASGAAIALWWPRFERAAKWFVENEIKRRPLRTHAATEIRGELTLPGPAGEFKLTGRADRIEFFEDGSASILDYKTGSVPSEKQIKTLVSPQLPLEGAMLLHGGFADQHANRLRAFVHLELRGAVPPGKESPYEEDATGKAEEAFTALSKRIARYDNPNQPYRSREQMQYLRDVGDYDHLARVREWFVLGEGGE
jgi:ATP-dependent helicase/nuclease subunit B